MRIAITGATGFLGKHLCLRLKELGHELFEYNTSNSDITGDVSLPDSVDIVYHLAGNSRVYLAKKDPFFDFKANALGTLNVLESMRRNNIKKIIYTSSDLVYTDLNKCGESDKLGANKISGPYGVTKSIAEYYIRYYADIFGIEYAILRLSSMYGPYMHKNTVFDMIQGFLAKKKIKLFHHIDSEFDFIYAADAVEALILAMGWKNETVNVSTGKSVSLKYLYDIIKGIMGYDVAIDSNEELVKIKVDNSKLRLLGWEMRHSLKEGLKRTIDSFRA